MKGCVGGLVIGIVIGTGVSAAAQGQWQNVTMMLGYGQASRVGYIEGVGDTLTLIGRTIADLPTPDAADLSRSPSARALLKLSLFWLEQVNCVNGHSRGTAGEFLRWADGAWQSAADRGAGGENAASVLIADACSK